MVAVCSICGKISASGNHADCEEMRRAKEIDGRIGRDEPEQITDVELAKDIETLMKRVRWD